MSNNIIDAVTQTVNSLVSALKLPDESAKANDTLGSMNFPQFSRILPYKDYDSATGLFITVDLRQALVRLPMPFLRLYGRLDGLVPRKIVPLLDDLWPESESILFDKAAHAPFVSHPAAFCEPLLALKTRLG